MKDCKFLVLLNDCLYSPVLFKEVKLLDPYSESRVKILTYIQNYFTYRMKVVEDKAGYLERFSKLYIRNIYDFFGECTV